jgi:hypothetical protein
MKYVSSNNESNFDAGLFHVYSSIKRYRIKVLSSLRLIELAVNFRLRYSVDFLNPDLTSQSEQPLIQYVEKTRIFNGIIVIEST